MPPLGASRFLVTSFIALATVVVVLALIGVVVAGQRRGESSAQRMQWLIGTTVATVVWLALTWLVAASGVLLQFDRRPRHRLF